jgi:hypothetical protein
MGDTSWAEVTVYDVTESNMDRVTAIFGDGWAIYDGGPGWATFNYDELSVGSLTDGWDGEPVTDELETLGLPYDASQDPKYEFSGHAVVFTPELGRWESETMVSEEGPAVSAIVLDALTDKYRGAEGDPGRDRGNLGDVILDEIDRLTGRKHRDAIAELRNAQK